MSSTRKRIWLTGIKASGAKPGEAGGVRNSKPMNSNPPDLPTANKPVTVVYACSGCSDAGEIADRVARQLTRDGAAKMSCLAGIGGRVKSLVSTAEQAERILVVDGCPLNCARHTLELAGFSHFDHLELQQIGIRKGATPVTDEHIASGVAAAKKILAVENTRLHLPPGEIGAKLKSISRS